MYRHYLPVDTCIGSFILGLSPVILISFFKDRAVAILYFFCYQCDSYEEPIPTMN